MAQRPLCGIDRYPMAADLAKSRLGMVMSHGALFRGGAEGKIRPDLYGQ